MKRAVRWGGLLFIIAFVAVFLVGGSDEAPAETSEQYDPAVQICEGFGGDDFVFDDAVAAERDRVKEEFDGDEEGNNLDAIDEFVESRETCSMDASTSTTVPDEEGEEEDPICVVTNADGSTTELPSVGGCDPDATSPGLGMAESNADPRTPPVFESDVLLTSWCHFVDVFDGDEYKWYRDGVARTAGVSWTQAGQYCELERTQSVDARVITVWNGYDVSDDEARAMMAAEGVVNADRLPVERQSRLVNTRGMGSQQMNEFVDPRRMVRVALVPILIDPAGRVIGLDASRGVFIDCYNAFRVTKNVVCKCTPPPPPPPTTCKTCTPPTTVKPTTTTTVKPTTTTTRPPSTTTTTQPRCKTCTTPTTTPPPPTTTTTRPPSTTQTTAAPSGGQHDSGDGATTNTTSPPTTQAPSPAPPTTTAPTTPPSGPPDP